MRFPRSHTDGTGGSDTWLQTSPYFIPNKEQSLALGPDAAKQSLHAQRLARGLDATRHIESKCTDDADETTGDQLCAVAMAMWVRF